MQRQYSDRRIDEKKFEPLFFYCFFGILINRSQQVTDACKKYGGFYLGSIGGPAAILAQNNIKSIECVEYPELGMEAIWKIEVEDFPAFILVDDKGNDFFKQLKPWNCSK